jgi:hypothetical protein
VFVVGNGDLRSVKKEDKATFVTAWTVFCEMINIDAEENDVDIFFCFRNLIQSTFTKFIASSLKLLSNEGKPIGFRVSTPWHQLPDRIVARDLLRYLTERPSIG